MGILKNFSLVVVNLIGDLWMGLGRKSDFYDKHSTTKTKVGYVLYVTLAGILAVGTVVWLGSRLY